MGLTRHALRSHLFAAYVVIDPESTAGAQVYGSGAHREYLRENKCTGSFVAKMGRSDQDLLKQKIGFGRNCLLRLTKRTKTRCA